MLRVAGGTIRGQTIRAPGDLIRPTQEKVRQAIFSSLVGTIEGCRFLDLFAGSGAVGLEAWSRGASHVCWVEGDARVFRVLRDNVSRLCVPMKADDMNSGTPSPDRTLVVRGDVLRFLSGTNQRRGSYDVVFADPPYNIKGNDEWLKKTLQAMAAGSILLPGGVVVIEQSVDEPSLDCGEWTVIRDRTYGGTRLRFLRK
jgi:16S rRNA (guanine966-N2)-methyltransferase